MDVNAPCDVVFDVLHDYALRLRWDTMLSEARLLDASVANKGVRSLCVGTWRSAYVPMETEYITFRRGELAAVRLTKQNLLFERFAASIRHTALESGRSRITYTFSCRVRPPFLAGLVEPIVERMMAREVRARLVALRDFIERGGGRGDGAPGRPR